MKVFINGKQKFVKRPQLIDGLPVDEFIARNADPLWLHQNGMWELIPTESDETMSDEEAGTAASLFGAETPVPEHRQDDFQGHDSDDDEVPF
ncbi:MAG: hypothetical protein KDA89_04160 [Planctomycetaceae bacterium]|nr:hypothetical protein [Planctomycetaceae bacterium]